MLAKMERLQKWKRKKSVEEQQIICFRKDSKIAQEIIDKKGKTIILHSSRKTSKSKQ